MSGLTAWTERVVHTPTVREHRAIPAEGANMVRTNREGPVAVSGLGHGRSVIVGLEQGHRLVAAFELRGGSVRLFVAIANARPSPTQRQAAERMLRALALA